jgi:aromatic-L-amino-acid decarboxylase
MNSLKVYLTLRVHGRKAYEDLIDRQLALAADFAARVRTSAEFELAAPQALPILNLRVKLPHASEEQLEAAHARIVEAVTRSGERWISITRVNGRSVLRMMVISYLTTGKHLDELWAALTIAVAEVLPSGVPAR